MSTVLGNPFSDPESMDRKICGKVRETRDVSLNKNIYLKQTRAGVKKWSQTCTCQFSESFSLEMYNLGSSGGTIVYFTSLGTGGRAGLSIQDIRSILIIASSCQSDIFFLIMANSDHLVAFFQRCSKFIRTSYAAGPSILLCKSCHGCLGALLPT